MISNSRPLKILGLIILVGILSLIKPFYEVFRYKHKLLEGDEYHFYEIFKDTVKLAKDPLFKRSLILGWKRKSDDYFEYSLKNGMVAHILTINDFPHIKIPSININTNITSLYHKKIGVETFKNNYNYANCSVISIKLKWPIISSFTIDLNPFSDPEIIKKQDNYVAYYGKFNILSIANQLDQQFVWVDLKSCSESLVVFYSNGDKLYIIVLSSDNSIEKSCIDLLNLKSSAS